MDVGFLDHIGDLALFVAVLAGPLPFSLAALLRAGRALSSDGVLSALCVWCVLQTLLGQLLGFSHRFALQNVLVLELVLFVSGALLLWMLRRDASAPNLRPLRFIGALDRTERLVVVAISLVGLLCLWTVSTEPITEHDSVGYHLSVMAKWYQTHDFAMLSKTAGHQRYPYNWEVLCSLLLMPFGEDFLVALPNLAALAVFGLSIYCLGRTLGSTRFGGLVAVAMVFTCPILSSHQINSMHVDLPFAAFFMVALCFAVLHHRSGRRIHAMLSWASVGMFIGIKTSGVPYAGLLAGAVVLLNVTTGRVTRAAIRPLIRTALWCTGGIALVLLIGGSWYVRNLVEVGNPVYPLIVKLGSTEVFSGPRDPGFLRKTTLAGLFDVLNVAHWRVLFGALGRHFGVPFVSLVCVSVAGILKCAVYGRRRRALGLLALCAATGVLYLVTPYSGDNGGHGWKITPYIGTQLRFALPFLGVLGAAAAAAVTAVRLGREVLLVLVFIASTIMLSQSGSPELFLYVQVLALVGWALFGRARRRDEEVQRIRKRPKGWVGIVSSVFLILLLVPASFALRQQRDRRRSEVYGDIVDWLDNNVKTDEAIGYVTSLTRGPYILHGRRLDKNVVGVLPSARSLSGWRKRLEATDVDIVAIGRMRRPSRKPKESRQVISWLENEENGFTRVFGEDRKKGYVLYRMETDQ